MKNKQIYKSIYQAVLASTSLVISLSTMASTDEEKSPKVVEEQIQLKNNMLQIYLDGKQYHSAVQLDLSDPDTVLYIDTSNFDQQVVDQEMFDDLDDMDSEGELVPKPTAKQDEAENPGINEAKSLALKIAAQKSAQKGDYKKALKLLNQAEPLTESPAKILALKGSVLYKLGKTEQSIAAWQKAKKLDPSLKDVKQMIEWLNK